MIVRASDCRPLRFGSAGDTVEASRKMMDALFFYPPAPVPPISHMPLKARSLARVAMLASPRVHDGFKWHNSCYELAPDNWKALLGLARPDYMLIESCFYDSGRAWPLACHKPQFTETLRQMANYANQAGIPAIFWHTLGPDLAHLFLPAMPAFTFVACADRSSLEIFRKKGVSAKLLPWAFAPEQFNPLLNSSVGETPRAPLFDGMARMMRFSHVRGNLLKFADTDLNIIDTGMLVPPYNLERFQEKALACLAKGNVSQKHVQEWYKNAAALLSIGDNPYTLAPGQQWRNLEAAACKCPVLHYGPNGPDCQPGGMAEEFQDINAMRERLDELIKQPLERERSGHLAWRAAHAAHTFAHRMDSIHSWIGLDAKAVEEPKISIVIPTMRPENAEHVLRQYEGQTWDDKELIYVFNGCKKNLPKLPRRPDIRVVVMPESYTTGAVMNAGIAAASGEFIFRFDDDDLYGKMYVADRMIYFREFDIQALANASSYVTFGNDQKAYLIDPEHNNNRESVFKMGGKAYVMVGSSGGSIAMAREYALRVPFQEQAYAGADCSLLLKGMVLTPKENFAKIAGFNYCVKRADAASHTWQASHDEIAGYTDGSAVAVASVFI